VEQDSGITLDLTSRYVAGTGKSKQENDDGKSIFGIPAEREHSFEDDSWCITYEEYIDNTNDTMS
jgi:hypothetical protein